MEDSNNVFRVGDFVWGKIKSHPWWPGQIYDSKDASAFAVKHSQEGRLLVAYFGDGSCSWCLPSQLVPFVNNFKQMSTDSSSKSFTNAIQSAVNEIGRLIEYNMLCKCVPSDNKDGLVRPVVSNAGVKKGVLVPDVDIRRLSVPEYEPAKILEKLMGYAKGVNVDSLLEVAILKSWLSAFCCSKSGGYRLSVYCEPIYIEGLEDKNKAITAAAGDFSVPIEVPIFGPTLEDDWLTSPAENDYSAKEPKSQKRAKVKEENASSGGKRRKSNTAEKSVDRVDKGTLLGKPSKIEVAVSGDISGGGEEELEKITSPRERKKSKYLSPPYTDHTWIMGNSGFDKSTKIERSTSPPISDEELPIVKLKASDVSGQTMENEKKLTFSASDVNIQVNELLSDIELAAVNPLYLIKKGSLDKVWAFVSALRSSTYLHGADYRTYRKFRKGGKKRKSLKNQENDFKTPEAAKTERKQKPEKSKFKKSSDFSRAKSSVDKLQGNVSTCLILTFTPGFTLPSKEEILGLFGKFGSLNEKETNVLTESHSVRIVYMTDSDAEAAFKSSITESPFGVENVNYWLQRSSDGSKARPKNSNRASENSGSSQETNGFMSEVRVIKQKLEIMTAILENYHSKFSTEEKSSLKDEMKQLMENVEMVSEKVRATAEKTSS
ncbi:serine/threonine-protein kinase atm [Phtheirospermum japonicum]|uniref:Serine/threonine-protein kinase atm n=1 Tax=Phtheirospermum japonicum TaxID=374723 RepID=A0A830CVV5_9LAMI|nr:serine/threonine-protein kinase atm [Phtheirospermum japonicum]